MSFLHRIVGRAGLPGAPPPLSPKGYGGSSPTPGTGDAGSRGHVARMEAEDDESPEPRAVEENEPEARRIAPQGNETEPQEERDLGAQRQGEEEAPEEETVRKSAVRRQGSEGEESEPGLLPPEQDEGEPSEAMRSVGVRRQEEEGEDADQEAIGRSEVPDQAAEEEEEVRPARVLRRREEMPAEEDIQTARGLTEEELSPEQQQPAQELAGEPEPPDVRALRRTAAALPPQTASPGRAAESVEGFPGGSENAWSSDPSPAPTGSTRFQPPDRLSSPVAGRHESFQAPPQIVIEQLDVLIHEPTPSRPPSSADAALGRALRARYLRRL